MSQFVHIAALVLGFATLLCAAPPVAFNEETLKYTVNWPSGLSLGEGELSAKRIKGATPEADRWEYQLHLDAAVPGFHLTDRYRSLATTDFCSIEFARETSHGARRSNETTLIQPATGLGRRTTRDGGSSEIQSPPCVKDALTFLYFVRSELLRGRVPPPQAILSGASYQARLEFRGTRQITVAEEAVPADRVAVSLKGPASQTTFDLYFAHDAARTPLLVSLPLPSGLVRMELAK